MLDGLIAIAACVLVVVGLWWTRGVGGPSLLNTGRRAQAAFPKYRPIDPDIDPDQARREIDDLAR